MMKSYITNDCGEPINILLVEDSEDDIEITMNAFNEARIKNNLFVVRNGQEGWEYLNRKGEYGDEEKYPLPQLILLDISMPKMGGLELLERIKIDDDLKRIPTVMLTTSKSDEDVVKSYTKGAAAYISKPINYEEFIKMVDQFNFFWQIVRLPKTG